MSEQNIPTQDNKDKYLKIALASGLGALGLAIGLETLNITNVLEGNILRDEFGSGIPNNVPAFLDFHKYTDTDGDGLSNELERTIGSDPNKADTDEDGFTDRQEAYNMQDFNAILEVIDERVKDDDNENIVISLEDVNKALEGFGFDESNLLDINGNGTPDLFEKATIFSSIETFYNSVRLPMIGPPAPPIN